MLLCCFQEQRGRSSRQGSGPRAFLTLSCIFGTAQREQLLLFTGERNRSWIRCWSGSPESRGSARTRLFSFSQSRLLHFTLALTSTRRNCGVSAENSPPDTFCSQHQWECIVNSLPTGANEPTTQRSWLSFSISELSPTNGPRVFCPRSWAALPWRIRAKFLLLLRFSGLCACCGLAGNIGPGQDKSIFPSFAPLGSFAWLDSQPVS